jgi:hypothetical protein
MQVVQAADANCGNFGTFDNFGNVKSGVQNPAPHSVV